MDSRQRTTVLLVILGVIVLLPVLGMSMWGFGMMGPGMMGRGGWGGSPGFGLLRLIVLAGGIMLIVLAFTRKPARSGEPLEILKARLAKGGITKEQYQELKQALQ